MPLALYPLQLCLLCHWNQVWEAQILRGYFSFSKPSSKMDLTCQPNYYLKRSFRYFETYLYDGLEIAISWSAELLGSLFLRYRLSLAHDCDTVAAQLAFLLRLVYS